MPTRSRNASLFTLLCVACLGGNAGAIGYGTYDARALSMAGTAVGVGDINQAHHYNPSLIAFHEGHEDRTQDGRHTLAFVGSNLSSGAKTAVEAITDDLEGRLSRAIDQLNDVPTTEAAATGIDAARDLEQAMHKLKQKDIHADGYIGYSVTLPADGEGGAFFVGSRLVGAGASTIEDSDFELLEDYVEALQYIATEGADGAPHPELFNEQNRLYDPSTWITSSARGTGIAQTEVGVAAGKQWQLWGVPLAVGAAPKIVQLSSYGESWRAVEGTFERDIQEERAFYFNVDVGVTVEFKQRYRIALAVKDLRERTFTAAAGQRIQLQPRTRLGLAYAHPKVRLGLDVDLQKYESLHTLVQQQIISAGIEYEPLRQLMLRVGYRHDLEDRSNDRVAAGIGWRFARFSTELAYSEGDSGHGAALQFSFYH